MLGHCLPGMPCPHTALNACRDPHKSAEGLVINRSFDGCRVFRLFASVAISHVVINSHLSFCKKKRATPTSPQPKKRRRKKTTGKRQPKKRIRRNRTTGSNGRCMKLTHVYMKKNHQETYCVSRMQANSHEEGLLRQTPLS